MFPTLFVSKAPLKAMPRRPGRDRKCLARLRRMTTTKRPPTVGKQALEVRELVSVLYFDASGWAGALAVAEAAAVAPVKQTEPIEASMVPIIERATLEFLLMRVARLFDPAEAGNASLPTVFDVLGNAAIRDVVLDDSPFLDRAERERHFDVALQYWARVSQDPRRERVRKVRSHTLAHNLPHKTFRDVMEGFMLPYSEFLNYAHECLTVVDELAWACVGVSQLGAVSQEAERAAERIWERMSSIP